MGCFAHITRLNVATWQPKNPKIWLLLARCEASAQAILSNYARHHEIQQILASTRLRATSRHLESTKGLALNQRTCDGPVNVEIAANEFVFDPFNIHGTPGITAASQGKFAIVGECEGVIKIRCFRYRQHGTKYFLAKQTA